MQCGRGDVSLTDAGEGWRKKRATKQTHKKVLSTARYLGFVPAEYHRMTQLRSVGTVAGSSFTGPGPSDSDNAH